MTERLRCPKCKKQLTEEDMGNRCPRCGEWQYTSVASKTLSREEELKKDIEERRKQLKDVDVNKFDMKEFLKLNGYIEIFIKEEKLKSIQETKQEMIDKIEELDINILATNFFVDGKKDMELWNLMNKFLEHIQNTLKSNIEIKKELN